MADVTPMSGRKILVLGADGQLGKALRELYDGDATVEFAGRAGFDLSPARKTIGPSQFDRSGVCTG